LIIPRHIWESNRKPAEDKNENPVGTGAYKVAAGGYLEDSSLALELRADLSDIRKAELFAYEPLQKIVLIKISNQDVLLNAIQKGDIDVGLDALEESKAYAINGNGSYNNVIVDAFDTPYVTTLVFNVGKNGAFKDSNLKDNAAKVRKAISLAINQDTLIANVRHGNAQKVGDGLVPDFMPHALRDAQGAYAYHNTDITEAKRLLDEAGYPANGGGSRDLKFSVLATPGNEPLVRELNNMIYDALGITIEFKQSAATYSEDVKQSNGANFDLIINTVVFDVEQLLMFDARFGVYPNGSPRVWNHSGVYDAELTQLMYQMDIETDIIAQYEKARAVQAKLAELVAEVPLFNPKNYTAYSTRDFKGWVKMRQYEVLNDDSIRYLRKA
jgi:ABC-type transport system substrate-binding protein